MLSDADAVAPSAEVAVASGVAVLLSAAEFPPQEVMLKPMMARSSEEADIANFFISKIVCDNSVVIDFTFLSGRISLHVAVASYTPAPQLTAVVCVPRGETAPFNEQHLDSEHHDGQSKQRGREAYVEQYCH